MAQKNWSVKAVTLLVKTNKCRCQELTLIRWHRAEDIVDRHHFAFVLCSFRLLPNIFANTDQLIYMWRNATLTAICPCSSLQINRISSNAHQMLCYRMCSRSFVWTRVEILSFQHWIVKSEHFDRRQHFSFKTKFWLKSNVIVDFRLYCPHSFREVFFLFISLWYRRLVYASVSINRSDISSNSITMTTKCQTATQCN